MFVAAILLALIIAILAIPFDIKFSVRRHDAFHSEVVVRWMFGIVKFTVPSKSELKQDTNPRKRIKTAKTQTKPTNFGTAKDLFWNARFRYRTIKFVKDIFKSIHIIGFYLRIRLGLDDPAETGRLWVCLGPLAVFLSGLSNSTIQLEPDFQTEIVYLDGRGTIRIIPLEVIFTIVAFLFSPITIRALLAMSKSRK